MKYAVSACLVGRNCKYNGGNNLCQEIVDFLNDKEYVEICPECAGGLPVPRVPVELKGERAVNKDGLDVTKEFEKGTEITLNIIKEHGISKVILKSNSPSCGCLHRYDGTFSKSLIEGRGMLAQRLFEEGFKLIDSDTFDQEK